MKQGWKIRNLKEFLEVQNGYAFNSKLFNNSEGMPLIRIRDLKNSIDTSTNYIGEYDSKYVVKKGDFLIGMDGEFGCFEWAGDDALLNQRVCRLQEFRNDLLPKFLFYGINKYLKEIEDVTTYTTVKHISSKQIKEILFPIPPFEEQKRIVAKLDQCFEAIDQAKANLECNLQNSKELFQSQLNQIFSQKGDGWVEKKLGEITAKIGSGATPRGGKSSYKESGISLIRSLNVYDDGFRKENLAFIDKEQAGKLNNVEIKKGDVLLNITGASVARCCIAPEEFMPARVNQHVSIIRLKPDILETQFLHYSLISKENKDLLLGIGEQGSTRQAITKAQIENFSISYPVQSSEQKPVVKKLDNVKSKSLELRSNYQQELDSLDELKKSILQKAFEGELSKTEIEVTI